MLLAQQARKWVSSGTSNIHKLRMAGAEQREFESMKKNHYDEKKRSINDIGRYTSATTTQTSWPRFSALVHPKGATAKGS